MVLFGPGKKDVHLDEFISCSSFVQPGYYLFGSVVYFQQHLDAAHIPNAGWILLFSRFCKILVQNYQKCCIPKPRSTHTTVFKRKEYLINIIKIWLESRLFYDSVKGRKSYKKQKHSDVQSNFLFGFFPKYFFLITEVPGM